MPFCLFYVSEANVAPERLDEAIDDIVRCSSPRNAELGITGALIRAGGNFAAYLEGPEAQVRTLMASIERDPRHSNVSVLLEQHCRARRFPSWSLVYSGSSNFVQRRLAPLLGHTPDQEAVWEMVEVMRRFADGWHERLQV